jgi:Phytanoyl-CoA dioxygenase (PhyH)
MALKLKKRQREALEHVKESLEKDNYAISHRDDLFGSDESAAWDAAEEWMERFAASKEAMDFEQAYIDSVLSETKVTARQRADKHKSLAKAAEMSLAAADAEIRRCEEAYAAAVRERDSAAGDRDRVNAAKAALAAAAVEFKSAKIKRKEIAKAYIDEKRAMLPAFKPYVFNHTHWLGRSIKYSDPPILLSSSARLLDIANHYHGVKAKVRIPTVWRVSSIPKGAPLPPREGSQVWHRDQTDHKILKLFMYFTDVTEATGALEYIPSSRPLNSKWGERIPFKPGDSGYPNPELLKQVTDSDVVKCAGRKGSLVFVDTAGLHRGGYATEGHRITVQATYLRPDTVEPQTALLRPGVTDASLSPEAAFAFS